MKYNIIKVALTPAQISKLAHGKQIQIKPAQVGSGHEIILKDRKVNRVHRRATKNQGSRFAIEPDEIEMMEQHGSGFLDELKKVGRFLKEKVFTNPVYREKLAPLIKKGLEGAVDIGSKFLPAPLQESAASLGKSAVGEVGRVSGAYGLKKGRRRVGGALPTPPAKGTPENVLFGNLPDFSKPNYRLLKGSQEAKDYMAQVRAARKPAGSGFKLAGSY